MKSYNCIISLWCDMKVAGRCGRCQMIGVDQSTGAKTKEPLLSLSAYRKGKVSGGGVAFHFKVWQYVPGLVCQIVPIPWHVIWLTTGSTAFATVRVIDLRLKVGRVHKKTRALTDKESTQQSIQYTVSLIPEGPHFGYIFRLVVCCSHYHFGHSVSML